MSDTHTEIQKALTEQDHIDFEQMVSEQGSPLNQPVVEKEAKGVPPVEETEQPDFEWDGKSEDRENKETDDAPPQEIGDNAKGAADDEDRFELPKNYAGQTADAFLGMADNVLDLGAGYFVRIRKHKEFYEFEEIIQVIDEQNQKNIRRIQLDQDDKKLLRPILIVILRKKAKKITPEQQLVYAILSILMKKARTVIEIKMENDMLVDRIVDIIREERGYSGKDREEQDEELTTMEEEQESTAGIQDVDEPLAEPITEHPQPSAVAPPQQPLQQQVMEVADDTLVEPS